MKLAILYALERPTLYLLKDAAERFNFEPTLIHFSELQMSFQNGRVDIEAHGISLRKFPLVFVREVRDFINEMSLVTKFCHYEKIPIVDSVFLEARGAGGKLGLMTHHAVHDLPLPKTFFAQNGIKFSQIFDQLSMPIVAKDNRGQQGRRVFLFRKKREFQAFYNRLRERRKTLATRLYFFQEFIPADCDMRVLVCGDKVLGAIERKTSKKGEFRHNVALGSNVKPIPVTEEMKTIALKAAKVLHYEFAGVDLIQNRETGKIYLLEVNRSPEFEGFIEATGIDVPGEVMKFFLRFLHKNVKSALV